MKADHLQIAVAVGGTSKAK